jgi:hypothetical protein
VLDLEGALTGLGLNTKIGVVGKWDPASQSFITYFYDGDYEEWTGSDFTINPGDGISLFITSSFDWSVGIITPEVP